MASETVITGNHPYPVPVPPEPMHVPTGMTSSQFRAMGTTISLLLPEEHLRHGEGLLERFDQLLWPETLDYDCLAHRDGCE